jgi:hypothetical protein
MGPDGVPDGAGRGARRGPDGGCLIGARRGVPNRGQTGGA